MKWIDVKILLGLIVMALIITWGVLYIGARWDFCRAYFPEAPMGCMTYGNGNPPVAPYRGAK